jgi:hypothetical protein
MLKKLFFNNEVRETQLASVKSETKFDKSIKIIPGKFSPTPHHTMSF